MTAGKSYHGGAEPVRSRQNRTVREIRRLDRDPGLRDSRAVLLAEGIRIVELAEASGARLETIVVSPRLETVARGRDLLRRLTAAGLPLVPLADPVMDYLYGGPGHQGILALVHRGGATLEGVLRAGDPALVFFGLGIQDPGNVGSLVRAGDAVGAAGVLLSPGSADPFGRRAVRASMGSVLRVPVLKNCDPVLTLGQLRAAGYRPVAADPRAEAILWDADLSGRLAVLIGAEGAGLPPAVRQRVSDRLRIPMRSGVDSLNVAATASLVAYEIARRRRDGGIDPFRPGAAPAAGERGLRPPGEGGT